MKIKSVILFALLFFVAGCSNEPIEIEERVTDIQSEKEAIPYVRLALQLYMNKKDFDIPTSNIVIEPNSDYNTERGYGGIVYENRKNHVEDHLVTIINYHVAYDGTVTLWHEELDNDYDYKVSFYNMHD